MKGLDRYLTSEPEYFDFDCWAEDVVENMSNDFYDGNQDWIMDLSPKGQCAKWMCKLFYQQNHSIEQAAMIIERAFNIYIK
jgi:hypothetical protein